MQMLGPAWLLILGFVLAASLVSGCAGSSASSGLPIKEDFSDCARGWSTDNDRSVALECTDGRYRFLVKEAGPDYSRLLFERSVEALSVEADATQRAGPKTFSGNALELHGILCWGSDTAGPAAGYFFGVTPDGHLGVLRAKAGARPAVLAESDRASDFGGSGATNRIHGECVGDPKGPTIVTVDVDGKRLVRATDAKGPNRFAGIGFFVMTSEGGTEVVFDDLVARELTATEAQRARAAPVPRQATRTGTTSKPSAAKLCKRDGIRYTGETAEGAEVCFTLTPDRSAWVEIGFRFVPASGCPGMAAGTAYSTGPVSLDAPGRIEVPGSFAATIRGARASGVFEDSEICGSKKFKWSADRAP